MDEFKCVSFGHEADGGIGKAMCRAAEDYTQPCSQVLDALAPYLDRRTAAGPQS